VPVRLSGFLNSLLCLGPVRGTLEKQRVQPAFTEAFADFPAGEEDGKDHGDQQHRGGETAGIEVFHPMVHAAVEAADRLLA